MLVIKIIILFLFSELIENYYKLEKYKTETKFSVYRSLMCIYFSLYSFELTVNYIDEARSNPFIFKNDEITELSEWFISYLIIDLEKMILTRNTRIDLYIHHIWCLLSFLVAQHYNELSYFHIFLLINESISIVSGLDSIYLEEDSKYESMLCKKYRKNIIRFIRLPIWITLFFGMIYNRKNLSNIIFWNGILTSLLMLYLDEHWYKKCNDAIEKYYSELKN
jgi:hypothetical protein